MLYSLGLLKSGMITGVPICVQDAPFSPTKAKSKPQEAFKLKGTVIGLFLFYY